MVVSPSFLSYTPVALTFGTSGLRGLVEDITDLEAYINVLGGIRYLIGQGDVQPGGTVILGGDLRPSTPRIMRASARAIVDAGCVVENAGFLPTPALMLHALAKRCAGVMVTGSHIPFDRNGIKINKSVGEVLKSDEPGITREVEGVRAAEYARDATTSLFTATGALKTEAELPRVLDAARERYVARYVDGFGRGGLEGLSVLLYEHSAVGRDLLGRILRELGADVTTAGRAETFIPIDTENITDELLGRIEGLLARAEAEGKSPDVIVSTDGDSDRPFVVAVRPRESGGAEGGGSRLLFLPGDLLGILVAEHLAADAVAVPISSNDAIERRMNERGVVIEKTKIGSPYVVDALTALGRDSRHRRIVGWEANGGFLLASEVTLRGAPLAPLPSRDSTLPILATLFEARARKVSLPQLWKSLPARYGRSGLKDDVPVKVSRAILAHLTPPGAVSEAFFDGSGEVRAGGVRLAEADAAPWRACARSLGGFFTAEGGFAGIERVNVIDGVRVYFTNGDVAHVRPSGNAPQLRIYANADSQARADAIVALGLREPGGILATLEKAYT
jgi:phosphomannomutase